MTDRDKLAEEIERALNVLEPLCSKDFLFTAPYAAPGCELRISTLRKAIAALRRAGEPSSEIQSCPQCGYEADDNNAAIDVPVQPSEREQGWQFVPKQWTSEMAHAGYEVHKNPQIQCAECGEIYIAMLAVAPKYQMPDDPKTPVEAQKLIGVLRAEIERLSQIILGDPSKSFILPEPEEKK